MRITRNMAIAIADSLTQKNKDALTKMTKEIDALVIAEYEQFVPLEIIKVANSCPSWVKKLNYVYVSYKVDGSHEGYYAHAGKFTIITKAGEASLKLNSKSPLRRKIIKLAEAREEWRSLRREIISALKDLRTSTKVIEQFPETAALFKARKPTAIKEQKVDLSELKSKLQNQ